MTTLDNTGFSILMPKDRPRPKITNRTHARLRHTYNMWHDDLKEQLAEEEAVAQKKYKAKENQILFDDNLNIEDPRGKSKYTQGRKSKFDSDTFIRQAVDESYKHPAIAKPGKEKSHSHSITFDFGCEVGFDARHNRRTSTVTVVVHPGKSDGPPEGRFEPGEVITVYPGF
ncbi:hypothetical protein [Noviherbaspirillum sp.]|uniref:hypothetical protein n=1 Tax=Noviherbaspirillum sp. TaxID=1926288 RepID=UPI002D6B5F06|nr:hypothetical protein [Noviherbaspirillum sp.]HZW19940.1 hypothetical protein [Noviherbaspirillum sp.]